WLLLGGMGAPGSSATGLAAGLHTGVARRTKRCVGQEAAGCGRGRVPAGWVARSPGLVTISSDRSKLHFRRARMAGIGSPGVHAATNVSRESAKDHAAVSGKS